METVNRNHYRKTSIALIALLLIAVAVLTIVAVSGNTIAYADTQYPDWLPDDYTVGITLGGYYQNYGLVTSMDYADNESYVFVYIFYRVPQNADAKDLKVRIRTKNGTAVAGDDYKAFDDVVTLRRSSYVGILSNGSTRYYCDYISIDVKNDATRLIVDGKRPYFEVELYDVLSEGFTIEESARTLRVNLSSKNAHSYTTQYAFGTYMLSGYLCDDRRSTDNLNIYSEDKANQALSASYTPNLNDSAFKKDYKDLGIADYYMGVKLKLDEKGVALSSWCYLDLYDGSTSGLHLYHGEFKSIWNDDLKPGIYYEDMSHQNESFASGTDSFKDESEKYGRLQAYYFRVSSGTLYETFKNGSNYWRKTFGWDVSIILIDDTAPQIKGWYVDKNTIQKGDKIRISVRFNEPLNATQTELRNVKLRAVFSGSGGFNNYQATFDCVNAAGSLPSDTLIFEFDPSAAKDAYDAPLVGTINNIEIAGFDRLNLIKDYGRNQNNNNNYCANYTTLQSLESAKMSPRQLRSDLKISFDNRSPVIEQSASVSNEFVGSYQTTVTTKNTTKLQGTYYLWSQSPDLNYEKVATPLVADLDTYYEISGDSFVRTHDADIVVDKAYYVPRDFDLAKVYELVNMQGASSMTSYNSARRYTDFTPFDIGCSANGNFDTTLSGVSGTYYLHVYAKTIYSDEASEFRRFGPVYIDNAAPVFSAITADEELIEKHVTAHVEEVSGLSSIILYLREVGFDVNDPEMEVTKYLLYGTTDDNTVTVPEEGKGFDTVVDLANDTMSFTLKAEEHLGLSETGDKAYGDYYIGIVGTDLVGNTSAICSTDTRTSFDLRATFAPYVKIGGVNVTDEDGVLIPENVLFYAENAYVVDISDGAKTIVIGRSGNVDAEEDSYIVSSAVRYENNVRTDLHFVKDIDYIVEENGYVSPYVMFDLSAPGYYEFTTRATLSGTNTFSKTIRMYVTDGNGNSVTQNYATVFNSGVNLKNKLFALSTSRYYSRTGTGMGSSASSYYNDSTEPLLFSSREKAVDYVKMMEYRDFYAVRFTDADVQAFNNGTIVTDRTESRRPQVGDVWIRYKSTTWNFSTNQRDWVYYYYGGPTVNTTVDINVISDSLASVVDKVTNIITQKGDTVYLTSLSGTNENGALYVDPSRIPQSFTATTATGTPSTGLTYTGSGTNPLEYTFDKEAYYDKYNDENDVTLISSYKFSYLNTTKIYYAEAKFDEGNLVTGIGAYKDDLRRLTATYLTQVVTSSGEYVIRELDEKGVRDYFVYVDVSVPTIRGQYTGVDSGQENHKWWNAANDGDVLYTTAFSISYVYDKDFVTTMTEDDFNTYLDLVKDADTYSYVAVFDVTDGGKTLVASRSLTELKEPGAVYELPYGVYVIEVCDRAGNHFAMTVSRAETQLTSTIEIVDNDKITFMVHDRIPSEIEKVYVTRPGMASQEIDFEQESVVVTDRNGKECYALVYTDAGQYEFYVVDKYGYILSSSTDPDQAGKTHTVGNLVRVNPYETVTWVTRSDEGTFAELDAGDISLFRADTYYITSDDKLTFVLDSTTIYSYAFTGNVTYKEIERTVDGKKYLYVNVDSTERWSVRIYYTLYPDVAVTYNRIAKRAVVPAAINLRALDKDSKGVAQADESNRIVVYVYTTDELESNVTVRLRTRDRSAIASLGDYDQTDLTVVLTPSEKEKMVTIQTHPSGISTYNSKTYEYANRTFDLFIESVEGNAEKGKSSMECAVPGVRELNIVEKDGILVFEDYLTGAKHGLPNVALDGKNSATSNGSYDVNNEFSVGTYWLSTYINSGLADLYVSGGMSISADDSSDSSALRLTLIEKSTGKQLYRVYLKNLEEHVGVLFGYEYVNKDDDDADEQPKATESYDKDTSIKLAENRGNAVAGRYFYVPSTLGAFTLNVHEDEFTRVVQSQYGTYTYYVLPGRNLNDILGYSLLVDTKAPTIQSWHVDHSTITVGEKLRLSVRFSEPVYISGPEPYVFADATGTSKSLTFKYAGGAGTDTLYFEFDPSAFTDEINIAGISLGNIKNYSSICDYAYNAYKKNNVAGLPEIPRDSEWDNSCSLDTRIPRVDLDGTYVPSSNSQRNATVPLNVSRTTSGAELQYSWTVESDAPADYEKSIALTASQQRVTIEASGVSGTYYLHVYIKSVFGKVTTETYGPFYFDNAMPTITGLAVEEATKGLKERNVTFYVSDVPKGQASSGIAQIYLHYLIKGEDAANILTLYDVNGDDRTNIVTISDNDRVSFTLRYDMLGIRKEEQKDVTLAFYAVDALGNSATISTYTYCPAIVNFDARSEIGVTMQCDKGEFFNADSVPVYNVAGVAPKFDFLFSKQADEYDIRELYIGGKQIAENKFADYIEYTADIDGVHVTFKNNVVGYVRINFKAITGAGESHTVQESADTVFYLTNGTDKAETANYKATESGTLLVNKVYMLDVGSVYYYHNGEGVRQKNYNETAKTMAFSTRAKALEYVKYYEMQDLTTRQLTASEASALNVGDGNYRKATADASVNASAGQVWIRYKRATWDRSESSNDWVYYYYGTSSEIDPERLPASLSTAISQVAETIVGKGGYRYLTSADDYLDKNGAPYLDKKQIAVGRLSTYLTNTGEEFRSVVVYEGDPDIYDSTVTPAGEEEPCSLVTTYNFTYGEYTKLFYTNQMTASGDPIDKEFKLLQEGTVFGSLNIDGGVYWMRECDENGVRDFKVYLDKSAPGLAITYENARGESIERELDSSVDGMSINGKVLRIKGFSATVAETDTMAYVAVFKKNGIQLNVYRREDIPAVGIEIGEGQYYLEIADRSGNMFKVSVSLNSTPMEVKVIAEENRHVRITCNRDVTEIKDFEIYLDNKLIESNYSSSVTYYQSGVYTIHIEDWFGNTFNYNYELKRELPKVSWFYDENDTYVAYDGTQPCLNISKTGEREYMIVTNKQLMFMYDTSADYEYEFSDRSISKRESEFNGYKRVRVNDTVDWTLTIRYARYPEIYVTYTCLVDTTPPIINVSARQDVVKYFDLQQIDALNSGGLNATSPEYYVPDTVYFGVSKTISKAVRNNSSIYSTLITMQFDDKSVCSEVEIYLDGVMIREYKEGDGVNNVTVNRFGEYRIVARDALGNQSEFNFINRASDSFKYIVDGKVVDTKLSPADSIVEEENGYAYQADMYSFDNVEFMYSGSGKIVFWVEKDGETHYLRYDCVDGALYEVIYRLVQQLDDEGNPVYDTNDNEIWQYQQTYLSTVIADMSAVEGGKSFVLATEDEVGVNISVQFDMEKNAYYHVDAPKTGEATVTVRIAYNDQYQPYFTKTVMSGELPEVTFNYVGDDQEQKQITPTSTEQIVYLNGGFFVAETAFANITEVTVAYSRTTEFTNFEIIYTTNEGYKRIGNAEQEGGIVFIEGEGVFFTVEGFYQIVAKNIYGRVAKYTVTMSNDLTVEVTTEYVDGFATKHLVKDDTVYKANKQVTVDVYADYITYDWFLNGEKQNDEPIEIVEPSGRCSIGKKDAGAYRLVIRDRFDNEVIVEFVIEDKPFTFKQDYLMGYNPDALRKDEGYSNQMLSVAADKMIADGIRLVTVVYGETETVVFDLLRDEGTPVAADRITNAIGAKGDGVYVLRMRNESGNVAETVLHYMGSDTLLVSRLIRTSREAERIAIVQGDENKIYSNYSVTFETLASKYEIRLDGDKADMPLVVRYPTDGEDTGEYRQTVTYVDEYGFKYSFEINLIRKQLNIDLSKTMKVVAINEVTMTQDDVSVEFEGSVLCEYTLDGGDRIAYQSGEKLTADGTYRFYVTDVAGNVHSTSIRKDTLVEFTFLYAGTDKVVENGSVIMEGSARFMPVNNDSAKLDLVVLNGEQYDSDKSIGYGESGKWEFLVSDDIGNKAYYYFYVLPYALSRFEYESPYAYQITDVTFDSGDGIPVSYTNLVTNNAGKKNSIMKFEETGSYQVTVSSIATSAYFTFAVVIDRTPPKAELIGAVSGVKTTANVSLEGCVTGDVVKVYKDGKLIQTVEVTNSATKMPEINEKGDYKIVITNAAGNEQVFEFTRKYTANVATTVTIIVFCLLIAIGLTVVLVLRKRKKV